MDPITIGLMTLAWVALNSKSRKKSSSNYTYKESPPDKIITFVGATGAGKSSTINALVGYSAFEVGASHGTTNKVDDITYTSGYQLRDTPGLMDDYDFSPIVWQSLKRSELIIYTASGQLYGPELTLLERIYNNQKNWNSASNSYNRRKLALYINKLDVKEYSMDSSTRRREIIAIKQQVSHWIPEQRIVYGASSPIYKGTRKSPRVEDLEKLINEHMNSSIN